MAVLGGRGGIGRDDCTVYYCLLVIDKNSNLVIVDFNFLKGDYLHTKY